ncbi:hypothetical protein DFJ77DRAFT_462055 [Powellomyces hirtus]|nr:hypothetical protein DFJ77DRAFT_462055 [Powellomyces hirtus]
MGVGGKTVPIAALRDWDSESLSLGIGSNPTIEDEFLRRPSVDSIASVEAGDPADAEASKLYAGLSEEQKAEVISLTYEDMLFECALEIAFEAHREEKLARSVCQVCHTRCLQFVETPGLDLFGLPIGDKNAVQEKFQCYKCNTWYPAQRYAPHLEKCLGFGGRTNSRSSSRRPGNERASASPLGADSDTESVGSAAERRAKRKESPLRKSLGKKMRTAVADSPRILTPKLEPVIQSSPLAISPYLGDLPDVDLQPSLGYLPAMDFIGM